MVCVDYFLTTWSGTPDMGKAMKKTKKKRQKTAFFLRKPFLIHYFLVRVIYTNGH